MKNAEDHQEGEGEEAKKKKKRVTGASSLVYGAAFEFFFWLKFIIGEFF